VELKPVAKPPTLVVYTKLSSTSLTDIGNLLDMVIRRGIGVSFGEDSKNYSTIYILLKKTKKKHIK
jgi:hypothetical protein